MLFGHAVKEALADGEILELGDPITQAEGLADAELAADELTVTLYDTVLIEEFVVRPEALG